MSADEEDGSVGVAEPEVEWSVGSGGVGGTVSVGFVGVWCAGCGEDGEGGEVRSKELMPVVTAAVEYVGSDEMNETSGMGIERSRAAKKGWLSGPGRRVGGSIHGLMSISIW